MPWAAVAVGGGLGGCGPEGATEEGVDTPHPQTEQHFVPFPKESRLIQCWIR